MINNSTTLFFLKLKRKLFSHPLLLRKILKSLLVAIIIIFLFMLARVIIRSKLSQYTAVGKSFLFPGITEARTYKGRLNVLILGKSGVGSDSPDLTDSMMMLSVGVEKPSLILVSIPRDIWIPSIRAKINSAYYWGNEKEEGGGLVLSKNIVEEIVGVPVEYAAILNFSVFKEVIDTLGGIEVNVERDFTDEKYPVPGRETLDCPEDEGKLEAKKEYKCRYETIRFTQGKQMMDGERALKYTRSRNAQGDEGTDLARDVRQQKVIAAIKDKILSLDTLLNPSKMSSLKKIAATSIETDIDSVSAGFLARKVFNARKNIESFILDERFLEHPPISQRYDYQYVFVSKTGSWDEVKKWIESLY